MGIAIHGAVDHEPAAPAVLSDSDVEMPTSHLNETARVVAAQAGDRQALEELLQGRLPFVYTMVRRAMGGSPEVDDVVQETMLRAVREVPRLSRPESFRAWLAAITIRQISTHRHRGSRWAAHTTALDDLVENEAADPALTSQFEDATVLHLHLADQRHQLVRARAWLTPEDQTVLSLWWLEATGELTRADLATALGVSIAHATVRVQRMHTQLGLTRALIAAIEAKPRCAGLDALLRDWNGRPAALWRKRILRHTRSCRVCLGEASGLIPPESLLLGLALLPVPAALIGKLSLGVSTASPATTALSSTKAGVTTHLLHLAAAKPVSALLLTGSVLGGAFAVTTNWPQPAPTPPVVVDIPTPVTTSSAPPTTPTTPTTPRPEKAAPSRTVAATSTRASAAAGILKPGPVSLESSNIPGFYAATEETFATLEKATTENAGRSTFEVVPGLADPDCYSFRLDNGQYLRHLSWRVRTSSNDGTAVFRGDATFCRHTGSAPDSVALEASNYPGWFLRHRDMQLWVDQVEETEQFRADSSFYVRAPRSD